MKEIEKLAEEKYSAGFTTDVENESFPPGISEKIIKKLSRLRGEPRWLLNKRVKAYKFWLKSKEPTWSTVDYPPIDYQAISYYSAPKLRDKDEIPQEILDTYEKLGVPLHERDALLGVEPSIDRSNLIAVDAVFDSTSVLVTFQEELKKHGIIFCSISEAVKNHPDLVRKYLGKVVPYSDNYFAALNSAVFSDGTFVYVPPGVRCPMELNTYFRINAMNSGQFERTLIIADKGSYVSYLEGCTAPAYSNNILHAAVVELYAHADAEIKYSTVQNWYAGDEEGQGGVLNFVTKRGLCAANRSKISWTQVETGSAVTWKYPSVILRGDKSVGEFYSVAMTKNHQQADTGTKMFHIGKHTKSTIISKGISLDNSKNCYRGMVRVNPSANGAHNYTRCDSLVMGDSVAITLPKVVQKTMDAKVEHEASTGKLDEEALFLMQARGLSEEDAVRILVTGFCNEIFKKLPFEFAAEANQLMAVQLEGTIG